MGKRGIVALVTPREAAGVGITYDGAAAMARLFSDIFRWLPNPR